MSELSDGQGADGKGVAQTARSGDIGGKRRLRYRRESPTSNGQEVAVAPAELKHTSGEKSSADISTPESSAEYRPQQKKRPRRTITRPGNKRNKQPIVSTPEKEGPPTPSVDAHGQRSNPARSTNRPAPHKGGKTQRKGSPVYAALDLGTNNCRLLMAVPRQRGKFRVVDGFSRIVRLGEGLSQTGRLGENAMDRAVEALKQCAVKLNNRKVRRARLIATEACRQAENGEEFLDRVFEETGLELEIVTRETEARLAAEGCGSLMDHNSDAAVMFDIGGGSTELILVNGRKIQKGRIRDRIAAWASLPMGVVTLAEQFGGKEVSLERFEEMKSAVAEELEKFDEGREFQLRFADADIHLLGTSGTVTTLAGIHLRLPKYERRRVDGLWMSSGEIDDVTNSLLEMTYEQRRQNACIGQERADLVLAGCAILEAIRAKWPSDRLRVADRGLREGLLTEMMNTDKAWRPGFHKRNNRQPKSGAK